MYQAEFDKLKIRAALVGVDLDQKVGKQKVKEVTGDSFIFKDPEEYKDLTKKEKEELTKKMMVKHKQWVAGRKEIGEVT